MPHLLSYPERPLLQRAWHGLSGPALTLSTLLCLPGVGHAGDDSYGVTKPAFGLVDGQLFAGEGTGRVDGTGTLLVFSQPSPGATVKVKPIACRGTFDHDFKTGKGTLTCDNGETAAFTFRFTGLTKGLGEGQSKDHGIIRFTFGLDLADAAKALQLPEGTHIVAAGLARNGLPAYQLDGPLAPADTATSIPAGGTASLPSPSSDPGPANPATP